MQDEPIKAVNESVWWNGQVPDLALLTRLGEGCMPGALGIVFEAVGPNWLRGRMPVAPIVHQPHGRLHGGASVALAETVASVAGSSVVNPDSHAVVGLEINANHIRAARDGHVTATATAESLGRTVQVWTIRIEDDKGKLVCLARMTAAVIARDRA